MIEVHGDVDIVAHANHKEMFRVMITFSVMLMFTVMLMLRVMPTFMHSDANYVQSDADVQTDADVDVHADANCSCPMLMEAALLPNWKNMQPNRSKP